MTTQEQTQPPKPRPNPNPVTRAVSSPVDDVVPHPALDVPVEAPEEPAVREEVKPSGFVAVTFSTDLLFRWAKREFR